MNDTPDPVPPHKQPPVLRYALILGTLALVAIVVGTLVGQRNENPMPSAVSSPVAGASGGPTPRY